jgi:hypothetical protein
LSRLATPMCDSGESKAASVGVRMISAPKAFSTSTFSWLIFSGSVMIMRYPFRAAASASPIPDIGAQGKCCHVGHQCMLAA